MLSTHLIIGEVLKPQGVKGEIKVKPITYDTERFEGLKQIYLAKNGAYVPKSIHVTRINADAVYLFMEGVGDRNDAELLRGEVLYIDRAHSIDLPEDTEFICDLIGCACFDDAGHELGKLTDVLQPGGNDVYVIKGASGEVLVPALKSVVLSVDVQKKQMLLSAARLSEVAVFDDN